YRGSRFAFPPGELEAWQPAIETGLRTAKYIQRLGYFGPLGIDALQYRNETGLVNLRPLQVLNACYTMGCFAFGFRLVLSPGRCGSRIHFGERHLAADKLESWLCHLQHAGVGGAVIVAASPRKIGGRAARHHAVLVLAPMAEILKQVEGTIFDSLEI